MDTLREITVEPRPRYSSLDHRFHQAVRWRPEEPAISIAPAIWMSMANSNRYLISGDDGDVIINTGDPTQAARHRERYEHAIGRRLRTTRIVFTQSHPDHYSGWRTYATDDVDTIAHRRFPDGVLDRQRLAQFFAPRRARTTAWARSGVTRSIEVPSARISTFVDDTFSFEEGGRTFQVIAAPGGETRDSIWVWLPRDRIVFTGNHAGALYGALPNLTTIRGDRVRSALEFVRDMDRLIQLEPAVLVTGHGWPIAGSDRIRRDLCRVRDAVAFIHDATVDGMNQGTSLAELMGTIRLPDDLALGPGRCPVSWCVRSVWEEYTGWFRFESPTELYDVPVTAVAADLLAPVGAVESALERARLRLAASEPLHAIHLVETVLAADPVNVSACEIRIEALVTLIDRSGGHNYDEITYLESELHDARLRLAACDRSPEGESGSDRGTP